MQLWTTRTSSESLYILDQTNVENPEDQGDEIYCQDNDFKHVVYAGTPVAGGPEAHVARGDDDGCYFLVVNQFTSG